MTTARLAISVDSELAERIRHAARGSAVSGWLADAAERKLRAEGLSDVVADWEAEHGMFTSAERRRACRELGLTKRA
jgi:hypothetical protein